MSAKKTSKPDKQAVGLPQSAPVPEQEQTAAQGTHSDYELLNVFCQRVESGGEVGRQILERIAESIRKVLLSGEWESGFKLGPEPIFKKLNEKRDAQIFASVIAEIAAGKPVTDSITRIAEQYLRGAKTADKAFYGLNKKYPTLQEAAKNMLLEADTKSWNSSLKKPKKK